MNCDQAFDVMTDAVQRDSTALQRHLQNCPRCRDLADAFAPALHLFSDSHEGSSAFCSEDQRCDAAHSRDADSGFSCGSLRPADTESSGSQSRRSQARMEGLKVAVVLLLVGAFTAAIARVGRESPLPLARVSEISTDGCLRAELDPHAQSAPTLAACLACHLDATESQKIGVDSRDKVHRIVRNCVVCHLEMTTQIEMAATDFSPHAPCSRRLTDG